MFEVSFLRSRTAAGRKYGCRGRKRLCFFVVINGRLQGAEYLLFGLGLASAACAVVLLAAIVAMGQRHPSVYKSGIINAFNPPAFAAAACALFTGMKLCRSCEQHEAVNNKEKTAAEDAGN